MAADYDESPKLDPDPKLSVSKPASPVPIRGSRSTSIASTKTSEHPDVYKAHNSRSTLVTVVPAPKQAHQPGLEALEAVSDLYKQLEDYQAEVARLREENNNLEDISAEVSRLRDESERLAQDLRTQKERNQNLEETLHTLLASLRTFSTAGKSLAPLFEVVTDALELGQEDALDNVYQIVGHEKDRLKNRKP